MIQILPNDTVEEIAEKIYRQSSIGDFVQINGWEIGQKQNDGQPWESVLIERGFLVIERMKWIYENEHYDNSGRARKFLYLNKNESLGGPLSHPIFRWERRKVNDEVRYTIWRYQ